MWLRVLATSLMVIAMVELSVEEICHSMELQNNSKVATALEGVSDALHCFKNVFQESVRDNKKSNDNMERLIQELEQLLQSTRQQNEQQVSKIQELETTLQAARDENAQLAMKVQTQDTLLKLSQQHKEDITIQLSLLNATVQELQRKHNTSLKENDKENTFTVSIEPQEKKLKKDCELGKQPNIAEHVEVFSWHRNYNTLGQGLGAAHSNSTPYKQIQHLGHLNSHHLWWVGNRGYTSLATFLVCGGLPADAVDDDGSGILHGAARGGHVRTASALLDLGAHVDTRGSMWRTPLMFAVQGDRLEMLKLLVGRGASLNATSSNSDTALHLAAREGKLAVVRFLVAAGADTTALGSGGFTALSLAQDNRNNAMINYLSQFPH